MKLSIVIPIYNEKLWVGAFWKRLMAAPLDQCPGIDEVELVVVDDCSTDGTRELLETLLSRSVSLDCGKVATTKLILQSENQGKGAAVALGIRHTTGDFILIQDADLEYFPEDFTALLAPLVDGVADAVIGSRFVGGKSRHVLPFAHLWMNRAITTLFNLLSGLSLTDMESCYKVFRGPIARQWKLTSRRFGIEPELAYRMAQSRLRLFEVPIRYVARGRHQGKKLHFLKDGFSAIYHIFKFGLWDRRPYRPGPMEALWQSEQSAMALAPQVTESLLRLRKQGDALKVLTLNGGHTGLVPELVAYGNVVAVESDSQVSNALRQRYGFMEGLQIKTGTPHLVLGQGGRYDAVLGVPPSTETTIRERFVGLLKQLQESEGVHIILNLPQSKESHASSMEMWSTSTSTSN